MNAPIDEAWRHLEKACGRLPRPVRIMEVCGTHTVSLFRSGIRARLPETVRLLSGPGCPVCVTPQRVIDAALDLCALGMQGRDRLILASYGDMLRVPGRRGSLERMRAAGADVRVVQSARAALELAHQFAPREVVFLAVGFETTAPATAATIIEARQAGVANFSVLTCHKLVGPAMAALLRGGRAQIDGFLCPGHVSVITGTRPYRIIARRFSKPCVIAGFEPLQMLTGLTRLVEQILAGEARMENVYRAAVAERGNATALALLRRVFAVTDTPWRALGTIPRSGLELAAGYRCFDAVHKFNLVMGEDHDPPACRCGEVIQGIAEPDECPLFGRGCSPQNPIGPCMVSGEGTCAAWHRYRRVGPAPRREADRLLEAGA